LLRIADHEKAYIDELKADALKSKKSGRSSPSNLPRNARTLRAKATEEGRRRGDESTSPSRGEVIEKGVPTPTGRSESPKY